jgi:hypothetical protein
MEDNELDHDAYDAEYIHERKLELSGEENIMVIDVIVDMQSNVVSEDDLFRKFIQWVESNGWTTAGGIGPYVDKLESNENDW